jgi:dihydrofolate reductase
VAKVFAEISTSLDGFVTGPNITLEQPLGEGGERLHEWVVRLASWRARHGLDGGERGADDDLVARTVAGTGAVVMGRRMFSGGAGPWADDPNADGWWGNEPPFRVPVFVVTHHAREPETKEGGTSFTFVTEGVDAAVAQAEAAAGGRDVSVAGGADVIRQSLKAGLLDELQLHVVPVLLGNGTRLFEDLGGEPVELETASVVESPDVAHLTYRAVT